MKDKTSKQADDQPDRLANDTTSPKKQGRYAGISSDDKMSKKAITEMLDSVRSMRNDLDQKLEDVREAAKEKNIDLDKYFGNIYSLTKKELESVQEQENILVDKLAAITPTGSLIKKPAKSKEKLTKERKGKFRGARQNWIPMK
jgi:hypothetical protein